MKASTVLIVPFVFMCLALASCGKSADEEASQPGTQQEAVSRKSAPPDLTRIKVASIQIIDGDNGNFRGLAGGFPTMNPTETHPELPCIWVIRSIREKDQKTARSLGVTAGRVYFQPREGNGTATLGELPKGGHLWLLREFDAALTDDQLFAEFESLMTSDPLEQIEFPQTAEGLVAMLGGEDTRIQARAAGKLKAMHDPQIVELLIAALDDPSADVRMNAVGLLVERPDRRAVEPLIERLKDTDWRVRGRAVRALAATRDPRAVDPLLSMLRRAGGSDRYDIIMTLGAMKDPRAVEPLIGLLGDDDDVIHGLAAMALSDIGDPRAVDPLIAALNDSRPAVITGAAYALGKLGDTRAIGPLTPLLKHDDPGVRRVVGLAISTLQSGGK